MSFTKKHQTRTSSSRTASSTSTTSSTTSSSHAPPSPYLQSLTAAFAPGGTAFDRAALVVQVSNNANSSSSSTDSDRVAFSAEEQLLLYGAYKQATKGDVKGTKPTFFDIAARSKWQAWANMRGKTTDQAKEEYIDMVVRALKKPGSHPDLLLLADEILQDHQRLQQPSNMDKDLPPISVHSPDSSTSPSVYYPTRKSSISHSIRSTATGVRSAATSVYELASETLDDSEQQQLQPPVHIIPGQSSSDTPSDPDYHEVTETVVEEEVLNDDDFAQLQSSQPLTPPTTTTEDVNNIDDDDDDDEDVYQSSEEYDEEGSESDNTSIHSHRDSSDARREGDTRLEIATRERSNDFVDEGVFDEEDRDEEEAIKSPPSVSPPSFTDNTKKIIHGRSRGGSASSGYGGSIMSDKEGPAPTPLDMTGFITNNGHESMLSSPPVAPYRVNAVFDVPPPTLDSPTAMTTTTEETTSPGSTPTAHHASMDGLVCPVSKKSAASGGVCPAAMFAQARAAAEAEATKESSSSPSIEPKEVDVPSTQSSPGPDTTSDTTIAATPNTTEHYRSQTEPISLSTPSSSISSAASTTVNSATRQGRRLGQGIVSRFSALRSSLAAASARAASSALSGGSAKPVTTTHVVVRDPKTQRDVTVLCPHIAQTQVLETEVVRLQTDISVLHERLDLLQESLKIKSQTREQERRSARGILKMVLRQGLINAVLLLLVFAVLYKRRSPIAFAIMAYVGHGAKEGEAGWRAFLRWTADVVRRGQRNQQLMLNAGRRNGYW